MDIKCFFYRAGSLLKYFFKSGYWKGHRIHSPFVFFVVSELLFEKTPFYAFKKTDAALEMLLKSKEQVGGKTMGASSVDSSPRKKVCKIVRQGSIPTFYGQFIFRLINHFEARNILELGTGTGYGTLFLALPDSRSRVTTIEGNPLLCRVAQNLFETVEVKNVNVVNGAFEKALPAELAKTDKLDFVFFDGDHRYKPTLSYFKMCLSKVHNDSVFVFDDIHWSEAMEEAWDVIAAHPKVTVSLDLYRIGVVFFRKECTKQHYVIRH
ncbi:O-methyltransferase [Marinilabilia rubra]|uniref:Methyltransferase n=1 Tax=Marinilabilia rubra TaxID=2162893 RepID=A0A2U2B669_9BACT|nr:class I SAM-dependent methyltransferase [Marinilabilia rubra]PWD98571.1 methyltransferase [Marinilabilia rubra]